MHLPAGRQGDFGTSPKVVIVIALIPPVDLDLAIVRIEVDVRNVTVAITRARLLFDSFYLTEYFIQNILR